MMMRRTSLSLMFFLITTSCLMYMYLYVKSTESNTATELIRALKLASATTFNKLNLTYSGEPTANHVIQHSHLELPSNQSLNEPHPSVAAMELQSGGQPINISITADKESKPVQVIIVTKMRSGSSFTGEIFNRNDDFVYYFEPLNEMKADKKDTTASFKGTSHQTVLKGILHCDFSHYKDFSWWNGRRPNQQCIQSLSYQPTSLCTYFKGKHSAAKTKMTDSQKAIINEDTCKSRPNIVLKTVRIGDIGMLKDFIQDPSLNIKIIHLVRDPRAVSNSRQDIHDPDNPTADCAKIEGNLKKYWINQPDWMRGHYMLLRYEDLAENPQYTVEKVYEFLNMSTPSSVKRWLDHNTKREVRSAGQVSKWTHTKDSAKTAHAWRTKLLIKFDKILEAQRGCKNTMQLLGYKPVISQLQMRDLKYSTLERYTYPLLPNRTSIE